MADHEITWEEAISGYSKQEGKKWFKREVYLDKGVDIREIARVEKRLNKCVKGALKYDFDELFYVTNPNYYYVDRNLRESYASNYPHSKVLPYYCDCKLVWADEGKWIGGEWCSDHHPYSGIVTDMSRYLALKGSVLFDIIDKMYDPKITKDNYSLTREKVQDLQTMLLNSLKLQKEYIEDKFLSGKITQKEYDAYMVEYNESLNKAKLITENWDKKVKEIALVKKVIDCKKDSKISRKEEKEAKKRLFAFKKEERRRIKEEARLEEEQARREKAARHIEETGSDIAD